MMLREFVHSVPVSWVVPVALPLDRRRSVRVESVLREHRAMVQAIEEAREILWVEPYHVDAVGVVERGAQMLLTALRDAAGEGMSRWRLAGWLDELVRSECEETMDRASTPVVVKRREMELLDRLNRELGHYEAWGRLLVQIVGGWDRAHVYDLAAGSGGFLRYLASARPDVSTRWMLTSSDRELIYVDLGRERAVRDGLSVCFEVRDALDLRDLAGTVDLFVCTQSAHHLTPGMVVRMMLQAMRASRGGVLVVDVMRGAVLMVGVGLVTLACAPFLPLVLDGVRSIRRGYTPSELELLARLAGATAVQVGFQRPAHVAVHARL